MRKIRITFTLLLLAPFVCFSQVDSSSSSSKKELRNERSAYLGITMGLNSSKFRDFATSPLMYMGDHGYVAVSYLKSNPKLETEFGLSSSFGNSSNEFNEHSATSKVKNVSINYSKLYELNKLSSKNLNVKIGGLFNTTGIFRINESLQNNGVGYELFPTLLGSAKITKDVSRKKDKNKKFLFIKYRLKQRTSNLAFRLNVGLINATYRNGYIYSGQSEILNDSKLFDDYQFNLFSGFRMSSALDYTISLKNKNKLQMSYLWDAHKTGGELDKFEMAQHILKFTFLFNTNNK